MEQVFPTSIYHFLHFILHGIHFHKGMTDDANAAKCQNRVSMSLECCVQGSKQRPAAPEADFFYHYAIEVFYGFYI